MKSAKTSVLQQATRLGASVHDSSPRGELDVTLFAPEFMRWISNQTHTLSERWFTDPTEGWQELASRMADGLEACDCEECESTTVLA